MTDAEPVAVEPAPARRPSRTRPRPAPRAHNADDDVQALMRQNQELLERLQAVESKLPGFVEQAAEPQAKGRVADDSELTAWQQELRRQTTPKAADEMVRTEPGFNVPPRWYMKTDGSVVSLQGDSRNLAYYTDICGYRVLSPAEERHYLTVEKPKILKLQQARANLINGIRRAVQLDPVLQSGLDPSWETDLDHMTIPELQAQFDEIASTPRADGRPRKMFKRLERLQDADDRKAEAEAERMLKGVETTPSRAARESFEQLQEQIRGRSVGGGRMVEITPRNAGTFA